MNDALAQVREEFLTRTRFCVLGTLRKDGRARLSPMAYAYEHGQVLITTTRARGGGRTAKRDPRVTVCCFDPQTTNEYLTVYGRAEILEDEATFIALMSTFRGHDLGDEELLKVRRQYVEEGRIVLRITPDEYFLGAALRRLAGGS